MRTFLLLLASWSCGVTGVFGKADIYDVTLNGEYYWELLFDIDNTGNVGSITRQVSVTTEVFCSYESMVRSLETTTTRASMGVSLGGTLFEVLNVGVRGDLSNEVRSEYEKMSRTQSNFRSSTTKTDTYEVGPNSRLKLYRLRFKGPGVSYTTDTLVSQPVAKPVVPINFKVKQLYVLKDIQVVYTDDSVSRPRHMITEFQWKNADINAGFGGKYVWLVPVWTKNVDEGVTGIQMAFQDKANSNYDDLAKGAKGLFRYIKMMHDPSSIRKITEIALWRSQSHEDTPTRNGNFQFRSEDINKGREGDWLWLCWNTKMAH